mgnify:CR=1 FL=1
MQTTKQSNKCFLFGFNLHLRQSSKSLLEFIIDINGHIMWTFRLFVHEVLKRGISCFLKLHIILKAYINHIVNFKFEVQKLVGKFKWILEIIFVCNDGCANLFDIGLHFVHNMNQSMILSRKHTIHGRQLLDILLLKHHFASCVHLSQCLCLVY